MDSSLLNRQAEFVNAMLVKMGKVRITDVAIAEEEFKKFDVSGDGWLTREDLAMLQDNKASSDPSRSVH